VDRSELVALVARLMHGDFASQDEVEDAASSLQAAVPHPRVTDLIFYDDRDLTAEQVVDEALAYGATPL
jgi:hypothetical protein